MFDGARVDTVNMTEKIRDEEIFAASFLSCWAGSSSKTETLGNGDTPDIRITFLDGSIGNCEVKRDADRQEEQLRSRLGNYGQMNLDDGSGSWLITLNFLIDFYEFRSVLQGVVDDLNAVGIDDWDGRNTVLKFRSQEFLIKNGVQGFRRIKGFEDDRVIMLKAPNFGVVLDNPNIVVPWLESVQLRNDYSSSILRLTEGNAQQKHLFICIDSNTPQEISTLIQFHPTVLPTEVIHLSPNLTHLWVASFFNFEYEKDCAWLFSLNSGWELVQTERKRLE